MISLSTFRKPQQENLHSVHRMKHAHLFPGGQTRRVIPTKVGIHLFFFWIPPCAGMTQGQTQRGLDSCLRRNDPCAPSPGFGSAGLSTARGEAKEADGTSALRASY
jgi:hypothetical protein